MSGSNVSYNSHGLLYVTCITLFRGSLTKIPKLFSPGRLTVVAAEVAGD